MKTGCFKAYDIRGRVPEEIDESLAFNIGKAFAQEIGGGTFIVGYDVRLESPALSLAVIKGLSSVGASVVDIGLCGTEEVYFNTFNRQKQGVVGGVMVTASHNPKGYCGMKLVREGARPVSGDTGLFAIRDRVAMMECDPWTAEVVKEINLETDSDKSAYIQHLLGYIDLQKIKPLRILANPGNGGAGPVMRELQQLLPFEIIFIHEEPDGNFPNGVPNPLLPEMRSATSEAVIKHGADIGIAWDGDFDRCFLFDHQGNFIEGYYLVGLLAEVILKKHPGQKIIHDPRLTWNTLDMVKKAGGFPVMSKTGHAFIKERMRLENAVYGGEMSAHHYFRDFSYCDSGMIPWLLIAELVSVSGISLAEWVEARISQFPCSGELNFRVDNTSEVLERVLHQYEKNALHIDFTDGISIEFSDWRFNLRSSNTESLLRLNVETRTDKMHLQKRVQEVVSLIY